jgi:hypothetical protein
MTSSRYFSLPTGPLFQSLSELRNLMEVDTKLYNILPISKSYVLNLYNLCKRMEIAQLLLSMSTSVQKKLLST